MTRPTDDELEAMAARLGVVIDQLNLALDTLEAERDADHGIWNAAIEAAAKVALDQEVACSKWFMQTGHHCNVYEQLPIVATDIRALKKGPTQ